MFKCQAELDKKAKEFISSLKKSSISGEIITPSFRDYTVKLSIEKNGKNYGNANLYYSPNKNTYTMRLHELKDKSITEELEELWNSKIKVQPEIIVPEKGYQVYVDGSFIHGKTGYGAVILKDGSVLKELYGPVPDAKGTHQVAGELRAVKEVIKWCHDNSLKNISIFFDYEGIEKWVTGAWMARQELTMEYRDFVRQSGVIITWNKVASHTGNKWNDRADELAKKGTGSYFPEKNSW